MAEQRKYRKFTAEQKLEIVLAGMRGDRSVRDICREHEISDTLYYQWRDKILDSGRAALAGKDERQAERGAAQEGQRARASARAQGLRARDSGGALRGWE